MKKIYIISLLSILFKSTVQADDSNLSKILKKSGKAETFKKSPKPKENISHYTFTFEEDLEKKNQKVETYEYKNSSHFQFKFTNEPPQNNFIKRSYGAEGFGGGSGGVGSGGGSSSGGGMGGGRGR